MKRAVLFSLIFVMSFVIFAQEPNDSITVTDGVQHLVPLEEVIIDDFSNFSNRFLPLANADRDDVLKARDRLRPFCELEVEACFPPNYENVEATNQWLEAGAHVIGYVAADGKAYAFPLRLLSFHGIVNDELGGDPILVVYCVYCRSAAVYSRILDGTTLDFGNTSTFYQSLLTVFDRQTESLWLMVNGKAIVGQQSGQQLEQLPALITTWQRWSELHPETQVLARRERYVDYSQDLFSDYQTRLNLDRFTFPVNDELLEDDRLSFGELVLVVGDEAESTAYPLSTFSDGVVTDNVAGDDIVILSTDEGASAAAYFADLNGDSIDLEFDANTGNWVDTNTQSQVDISGQITSGPLQGETLRTYPSRYMYWFAALVAYPDIRIFE